MFITRASRHDKTDVAAFLGEEGWDSSEPDRGVIFFARDGRVVGSIRLVEVEPQIVVVDDFVVAAGRRGEGIGRALMQAAMNSRGGTMYLCCHDDRMRFYSHFGFSEIPIDEAPDSVREYWEKIGDWPTEPGHDHYFMRAR